MSLDDERKNLERLRRELAELERQQLTLRARERRLRLLSMVLFVASAVCIGVAIALLLSACGGSVEAEPPAPACESPLHVVRYSSPVRDPGGTAETQSVECVQPGGWSHDGLSRVWCCE